MSITNKHSIKDIDVKDKRVLVRVDFSNDARIVEALPTIKYLQERGASGIVLMSHLGRPNGQVVAKYSLKPVADKLENLLKQPVTFLSDCVGAKVETACANLSDGQVVLLENLQFHIEEEGSGKDSEGNTTKADPSKVKEFRESLTKLGDIYVNDACGASHNAHSSMVGIDLPVRAAGLSMQSELEYFGKVTENPDRPYLAIVGGSKLSDKIQLIDGLLDKVDIMIITGDIAYTFLKVLSGMNIGDSLYDHKGAKSVKKLVVKARERGVEFALPVDFMAADEFSDTSSMLKTVREGIPVGWKGLDIGPMSIKQFGKLVAKAKTIVWNGAIGAYEHDQFAHGTKRTIDSIVEAFDNGATTIIAGNGTAEIAANCCAIDKFSHVSKGGSASLRLLERNGLPGVDALSTK
ncbi:phosphoglycerate kinase [Coemansia sp. RSA 520]|nr:phosphoglycerate kinase [Coemansia sp. RSA 788]KAJ2174546.1 phosphoglycerate kinase [Coemansia sp. RSA 560]KAJ2187131.1 phosphoglycerate kinase [Coemansia sp. RSA 532]KAJ2224727.1 phosphoglycerate kinase [Coemansia sp. RSA 520]